MSKKKFFVTGSSGFVGSNLVKKLYENGYEVYGSDISQNRDTANFMTFCKPQADQNELSKILIKIQPDFIIHCAGNANVSFSVKSPLDDFERNVLILYQLLEAVVISGIKTKILFPSSAAVYGTVNRLPIHESDPLTPISPYGLHKKICEDICLYYTKFKKLNISITRIFSAYGPRLKKQIFWDMYQKTIQNKNINLFGTGYESRDFIFIEDLIDAFLLVLFKGKNGEIYNLGSGVESSIKDVAVLFTNEIKDNVTFSFSDEVNEGNPLNWRANIDKIKELGFNCHYDLKSGIEEVVKWMRSEE